MKKVFSYTIGWDTIAKQGYLTAIDEEHVSHAFGPLGIEEFKILNDLLKEGKVFIDNKKWLITGWNAENIDKKII